MSQKGKPGHNRALQKAYYLREIKNTLPKLQGKNGGKNGNGKGAEKKL